MIVRACAGLAAGLALAAAAAPALADTANSSNWSGYAAHRRGVVFRRVRASWTQPAAACTAGQDGYSSFWVGLGGYSPNASGLEQIGTELDCQSGGHYISVWYELVPAPSQPITMSVRTGDRMSASVTVVGHRVTLRLTDHSRGESFSKLLTARSVDVTSAEWIAEAPSICNYAGFCRTLPLADFGAAHFSSGLAETAGGHIGAISSTAWNHTRIVLSQAPSPFTGLNTQRTSTPSTLQGDGSAFVVRYGQGVVAPRVLARGSAAGGGGAVQPGGLRH